MLNDGELGSVVRQQGDRDPDLVVVDGDLVIDGGDEIVGGVFPSGLSDGDRRAKIDEVTHKSLEAVVEYPTISDKKYRVAELT